MQIHFHGGARTVTGSQYVLTVNGRRVLVECGLFQGRRQDSYERNLNLPFEPAEIDSVVLSHAHIDHSGNLPNLVKSGYGNSIFATMATCDLCQIMLRDSAHLNERDAEWVNKIRLAKHEEPVEPIYRIKDAEAAMKQFVGVQYGRPFQIAGGVKATFQDAGHILGSAGVLLELSENGRQVRFGFSGDIGRPGAPILRDPEPLRDLDVLVMESTYGDRLHPGAEDCHRELADIVKWVVERGGRLLIPAFAVERTQVIVYTLYLLREEGLIPSIPIYIDSPLACNATDIFRAHPENFDEETYDRFMNDDNDPFESDNVFCVRSVEASKRLLALTDPHIIVAASGMMEGGRILHHARNHIGDAKTLLLFVGFAAPETLARRLMDGEKKVKIFGEEHAVRCEVRTMPYFSAHGDRNDLLSYVGANSPERLKQIFLVHGEVEQAESLKKAIEEKGFTNVRIPDRGEAFPI